MKILILIFFFKIKESKITRGHNLSCYIVIRRRGMNVAGDNVNACRAWYIHKYLHKTTANTHVYTYTGGRTYPIIKLKDTFFEPAVGSRPKFNRMCG